MTNPLIIAYYYTVEKSSTGQILRRFFPNFSTDFIPTIISKQVGPVSNIYQTGRESIVSVKEKQLPILVEKIFRNLGLNDLMMTPDYYRYSWGIGAFRKACQIMNDKRFDYVHTISFPSSSHLLGYKIKKRYGIPWVAQFYDPWHGNPFRPINNRMFIRLDSYYERIVAENADLIIMPCQELVSDWVDRYGVVVKEKVFELPFVIDQVHPVRIREEKNQLVLSLIGTSNSKRSSSSFLLGVHDFLVKHPEKRTQIRVDYVGIVPEVDISMISNLGLQDCVNVVGYLSEMECNRYFEDADIFLAIDADLKKNLFFPSKLLKYYSYNKPILGIVSCNSVLERELSQSGHKSVRIGNSGGIVKYLEDAFNDYHSLYTFDTSYCNRFLPSSVVPEYERRIRNLIGEK